MKKLMKVMLKYFVFLHQITHMMLMNSDFQEPVQTMPEVTLN